MAWGFYALSPNRIKTYRHRERRLDYEGSFFCETDVREVQGYQEKGKNHDYLREPEAQAETGLSRTKSGMYAQNCALTIYDEIKTCRRAEAHPDMRTGLFRWNIALNTGSGFVRISPAPFQYRKAGRAHLQG